MKIENKIIVKAILVKLRYYKHSYIVTVVSSLLIGLYCGLNKATEQCCTETGMVLAGMIKYPPDTPFYYYNIKVFALINQISALLLWITESSTFVNIFVSVLLGIISCLALSLLVYAFCRNSYISVGALLVILNLNMISAGIVYPIWLYGMRYTYGIIGLSFMVLTLALFGCRKYKWALICTGLAPSIHPSWGMFMALILATGGLLNFNFSWMLAKKYWKYFAIGFGISIAALVFQIYLMQVLPSIDVGLKKQYINSFIRYWDFHRQQFDFSHRSVWIAGYCFILSVTGLCLKFRSGQRFLLSVITATSIFGFAAAYISHLSYDIVPMYILIFMPGRYFNMSIFLFPALFTGLLFSRKLFNKRWSSLIYLGTLIFWYFQYCNRTILHVQLLSYTLGIHGDMIILGILLLLTASLIILLYCRYRNISIGEFWKFIRTRLQYPQNKKTHIFLLMAAFAVIPPCVLLRHLATGRILPSISSSTTYLNNNFYKRISLDKGTLLNTNEGFLISLKTKRPVWFDMGALDGFPMVPECAKVLNSGLQEIYGVSLLNPPAKEFRNRGILPSGLHRVLWEKRSRSTWLKLAGKYNFTGIIVPQSWKLKLNRSTENDLYAYYTLGNK